jgi:hypothetical protein
MIYYITYSLNDKKRFIIKQIDNKKNIKGINKNKSK